MDGRALKKRAHIVDCRSLMVECPEHKGILLPATDVHVSYTKESKGEPGEGDRLFVIFIEALCVYCNKYTYLRVKEGIATRFSDEENAQLMAVQMLVTRCPGMLLDEVLDVMTAAGGSRSTLATVIHMGVRANIVSIAMLDGRLYPDLAAGPQALEAAV